MSRIQLTCFDRSPEYTSLLFFVAGGGGILSFLKLFFPMVVRGKKMVMMMTI